jgi:glycosyltransferase involved in cell wall biosynthesis
MFKISAVIPTCGRPQIVRRAIASVLCQSYVDLELLVVVDGKDDGSTREAIESFGDPRVQMVETGSRTGPAAARYLGIQKASGRYIALLDDDDEWMPTKLSDQMEVVDDNRLYDADFIISSKILERVVRRGDVRSYVRPSQLYDQGTDFSGYIMDRQSPFGRPGMIASGTLLFPRQLALRVPFPNDEVHEDWSWLLLCIVRHKVPLFMCDEALTIYHLDLDTVSRSRGLDWAASVAWARRNHSLLSRRAMAGFVSSTVAIRAKRHSGWAPFFGLAALMRRDCQPSALHWLTLLGVFVLPVGLGEYWRRLTFSKG